MKKEGTVFAFGVRTRDVILIVVGLVLFTALWLQHLAKRDVEVALSDTLVRLQETTENLSSQRAFGSALAAGINSMTKGKHLDSTDVAGFLQNIEDTSVTASLLANLAIIDQAVYQARQNKASIANLKGQVDQQGSDLDRQEKMLRDFAQTVERLVAEKKEQKQQFASIEEALLEVIGNLRTTNDSLHQVNSTLASSFGQLTFSTDHGTVVNYVGQLNGEQPEGLGVGFYEGAGYYIGSWSGSHRNGYGEHHYRNGDRYEGDFKDDVRHGQGVYKYTSGQIYRGFWEGDLRNGYGEFFDAKGVLVVKAIWKNDEMQERLRNGK